MTLLTGWPLAISAEAILHGQGMDPRIVLAGKPDLLAAAERARVEGFPLIHPAALFTEIGVREHRHNRVRLEDGSEITGPLAARHLAGAQRIVPVICTIGPDLEETVSQTFGADPLFALALDGLGNAAVELLSQQVCAHIGEQMLENDLTASTPLSPGDADWPVGTGQKQLFSLLDASIAGVQLNPGGMMIPKKSVSFVIGIGPDMSQTGLCELCNLKETCRYQHVP